jgi:hypothetical protein
MPEEQFAPPRICLGTAMKTDARQTDNDLNSLRQCDKCKNLLSELEKQSPVEAPRVQGFRGKSAKLLGTRKKQ